MTLRDAIALTYSLAQRCTRRSLALATLALALTLSGCASMSKDECIMADWTTIGYQDGARGASTETISSHRKACAKHGVAPDLNLYLAGWNDGILTYCTVQNGFNAGSNGQRYAGVCPSDLEEEFLVAFGDGRQLYVLRTNLRQITFELDRAHQRIHDIKIEILDLETDLILPEGDVIDRVKILAEIKNLTDERHELEDSLDGLAYDRDLAQDDLDAYLDEIAGLYGL